MLKTLLLHVTYPSRASYQDDWFDAFKDCPDLDTKDINLYESSAVSRLKEQLVDVDLIVLLHSCTGSSLSYVEAVLPLLQARCGKLLSFVGNEFNIPHIPLSSRLRFLKDVQADYVATQLPLQAGQWLYEETGSTVIAAPHALNPAAFKPGLDHTKRPKRFGVRGYRYPVYLGDNERNRIVDYFLKNDPTADISFTDRLNRAQWAEFLGSCRATLTTEAGGWYLDRGDQTVQDVYDYVASQNSKLIVKRTPLVSKVVNGLPYGMKQFIKKGLRYTPVVDEATAGHSENFNEVFERFFKDKQKCPVYCKSLSSRHFDAIGTKTIQVSFPGRFNDLLVADKHFIVLNRDFSNIDDVLEKVDDPVFTENMAQETLDCALESHTYNHRIKDILNQVRF